MTIATWPHKPEEPKDPNADLDYTISWADWLADGESIIASEWIVQGAKNESDSFDSTSSTVWLSGGTVGATIIATNRITTDNATRARIDDRSLVIKVKER